MSLKDTADNVFNGVMQDGIDNTVDYFNDKADGKSGIERFKNDVSRTFKGIGDFFKNLFSRDKSPTYVPDFRITLSASMNEASKGSGSFENMISTSAEPAHAELSPENAHVPRPGIPHAELSPENAHVPRPEPSDDGPSFA